MNQYKIKYGKKAWVKFEEPNTYKLVSTSEEATHYWTRRSAAQAIENYIDYLNKLTPLGDTDVLKSNFEIISERLTFKVKELWEYR